MKYFIIILSIQFVYLFVVCGAIKYTFGRYDKNALHLVYQRTLINDVNEVPKNYTIIYKYFGGLFRGADYMEIDVNVNSTDGYLKRDYDGTEKFHAEIHINNVLNVTVTITIYRFGFMDISPYSSPLKNDYISKSLMFIYVKNAIKTETKSYAQNAIGHRQKGDELIYFESRNVTNMSRFPSRVVEYSGIPKNEYITYVGFSFNSPTAMVLVNTTFIGEQEFNAAVYDMNTEHFVANMSVYGIRRVGRPIEFVGLI